MTKKEELLKELESLASKMGKESLENKDPDICSIAAALHFIQAAYAFGVNHELAEQMNEFLSRYTTQIPRNATFRLN